MKITKAIRRLEYELDSKIERFVWRHPIFGFFSIFVGMPLFVLTCVCISTVLIAFPITWFLGWL